MSAERTPLAPAELKTEMDKIVRREAPNAVSWQYLSNRFKLKMLLGAPATTENGRFDDWQRQHGLTRRAVTGLLPFMNDLQRVVNEEEAALKAAREEARKNAEITADRERYDAEFPPEMRLELVMNIRKLTGDDEELLPLGLEEFGIPMHVYTHWLEEQQVKPVAAQQEAAPAETPLKKRRPFRRPPSALYLDAQESAFRLRTSEQSMPEQRLRLTEAIENDDQRRRSVWMRRMNISEHFIDLFKRSREQDLSLLRKDWMIPVNTAEGSFKALPDVQRLIRDGKGECDLPTGRDVLVLFDEITGMTERGMAAAGLRNDGFELFLRNNRDFYRTVNELIGSARPVIATRTEDRSFRPYRTVTYDEAVHLLRTLDAGVKDRLARSYLDGNAYALFRNYVRDARREALHVRAIEPLQSASSLPQRGRTRQAALRSLWSDYRASPDEDNRNRLIEAYLPIVHYQAEQLAKKLPDSVDVSDLLNAGVFGMMDAVAHFDESRGVRFETYCVPRIRGAMLDEMRHMDFVPRLVRSRASTLAARRAALFAKLGRPPTVDEETEAYGMTEEQLAQWEAEAHAVTTSSLQTAKYETDSLREVRMLDLFGKDSSAESPDARLETEELFNRAFKTLKGASRDIMRLYHVEGATMKQIGDAMDLSESRVSQMHSRAMIVVRHCIERILREKKRTQRSA